MFWLAFISVASCLFFHTSGRLLGSRSRCSARTPTFFRNANVLEAALEHRAFRLLRRVEARLAKDVGAGRTSAEAWNRALVEVRQLF